MASSATRSNRQTNTRTSQSRTKLALNYAEDSTEESEGSEDELSRPPPKTTRSTRRSTLSSYGSDIESVDTPRTRLARSSTTSKPTTTPPRKRVRTNKSQTSNSNSRDTFTGRKRRKVHDSSQKKDAKEQSWIIPSDNTPKWLELPYGVWVQIFKFATYPLYDQHTFQPTPSSKWLLDVALVCRDFAEPALTVLLATPPLVPMAQAHSLVNLLKTNPRTLKYKYRAKVETLQIEVYQVAKYSLTGSGVLDLYGLIKDLPRLKHLEFYHKKDMSPYRELDDNINWTYPESLVDALEYVDAAADGEFGDKTSVCRLQSWRWSSRMAGTAYAIEKIPGIHLTPPFASLQKIAFVNYQVKLAKKDEESPKHENVIATALGNLRHLKHLVFESSTLMNQKLLPLLPRNLHNLELINCWEIVSEGIGSFLESHGSQLECLILNHNQSLNLSFLPVLGHATPKLKVLRMNFTYYNIHATYRDSEPQYEHLLTADEIPSWPSTLQVIEMTQMRKWQTDAAEMFFQSLLDSADRLPDLRKLSLQAILNIGWRDRASFRDEWVGSLARVFKRTRKPPIHNTTIRKPAVILQVAVPNSGGKSTTEANVKDGKDLALRKSSRALVGKSNDVGDDTADNSEASSQQRATRSSTRQHTKGQYAESDSEPEAKLPDSTFKPKKAPRQVALRELEHLKPSQGYHGNLIEDSQPGSGSDSGHGRRSKDKNKGKEFIQGMCDIVEVRIDNLRPTENQVTERDFLDEEKSGDEDWNGEDDVDDRYAW